MRLENRISILEKSLARSNEAVRAMRPLLEVIHGGHSVWLMGSLSTNMVEKIRATLAAYKDVAP